MLSIIINLVDLGINSSSFHLLACQDGQKDKSKKELGPDLSVIRWLSWLVRQEVLRACWLCRIRKGLLNVTDVMFLAFCLFFSIFFFYYSVKFFLPFSLLGVESLTHVKKTITDFIFLLTIWHRWL
jgi:hypothetical protein